jgi:hypothetical protein
VDAQGVFFPLLHGGAHNPLIPSDATSIPANADDEAVWQTLFEGFPWPYTMKDA